MIRKRKAEERGKRFVSKTVKKSKEKHMKMLKRWTESHKRRKRESLMKKEENGQIDCLLIENRRMVLWHVEKQPRFRKMPMHDNEMLELNYG